MLLLLQLLGTLLTSAYRAVVTITSNSIIRDIIISIIRDTVFYTDCGAGLRLGEVRMIDGSHGDWQTDFAALKKQRDDRNYITASSKTETQDISFTS